MDADSQNYDDDLAVPRKRTKKKPRVVKGPSMSESGLMKRDSIEMTDIKLMDKNGSG
jgi:hypothetical protein